MTRARDELLTQEEAAAELRMPVKTLINWRSQGKGPEFIEIHRRLKVYSRAAIEAYKRTHTVQPAG